jgi:hypothetical protein
MKGIRGFDAGLYTELLRVNTVPESRFLKDSIEVCTARSLYISQSGHFLPSANICCKVQLKRPYLNRYRYICRG